MRVCPEGRFDPVRIRILGPNLPPLVLAARSGIPRLQEEHMLSRCICVSALVALLASPALAFVPTRPSLTGEHCRTFSRTEVFYMTC